MWRLYEHALTEHGLLWSESLGRDVVRLQLMTGEDVEILHSLITQGVALTDLLDQKDRMFRNLPFKNFLLSTVPDKLKVTTERRERELDRIFGQLTGTLLPPSFPAAPGSAADVSAPSGQL